MISLNNLYIPYKYIYFILSSFLWLSCKNQKNTTSKNQPILEIINCPEGGNCVFTVLKDSNLEIKTDAFGKIYPEITSGNNLVIKYEFKKIKQKNIKDGNYTEYVYFEINKNEKQLILEDQDLQKVKMLFGRICYCKGKMGYFKVTQGKLFLFNKHHKLQINTNFEVKKIPQIVNKINETIKY